MGAQLEGFLWNLALGRAELLLSSDFDNINFVFLFASTAESLKSFLWPAWSVENWDRYPSMFILLLTFVETHISSLSPDLATIKLTKFIFWSHLKSFGEGDGIWIRYKVVTDVHYKLLKLDCLRKIDLGSGIFKFLGKNDYFLLPVASLHFMNLRCY